MLIPTKSGKAKANNIEIYFETFGNESNPAILLIMGLDAQCINFSEYFINPLLKANYYVIRFDNRDIGLSTWLNETWRKEKPYTILDMALDSVGLLDFLQIKQAHILGVSMGGMIAQQITISFPERVLSLTCIMSSGFALNPKTVPWGGKLIMYLMPFLTKRIYLKNKLTEHEINVRNYVKTYRRLAGRRFPYNTEYFQALFTEAIETRKGQNPRGRYQQYCAIVASGSRLKYLPKIEVPTLILHGTNDPLVPPIHAKIYAPLIPNAKLVWLDDIGHELPIGILPQVHEEFLGLLNKV
jgi:pimeloyl-ACP methyl ester carboxylesterase